MKQTFKLRLAVILLLVGLGLTSKPAYARWPPFDFTVSPTYNDGKIVYQVDVRSRVDWMMTDLVFKFPLPAGTRFLEATDSPVSSVRFDGAEITIQTVAVHPYEILPTTYFIVEVTDPAQTVFTTQAWIAWEGDEPGDYLKDNISLDITQQVLDWVNPASPGLELNINATSTGSTITYEVYARKQAWVRMWDLKINIPVPQGTTFLSAQPPPTFVADFNGSEVSFSTLEMERWVEVGPLAFTVSVEGTTTAPIVTHAWASWKNAGARVGTAIVPQEQTLTGDIIVQPDGWQRVVADPIGDVPFANYDLTSLSLHDEGPNLLVTFYTVGTVGPVAPLDFYLYIDSTCRDDLEYRVRASFEAGQLKGAIDQWDKTQNVWQRIQFLNAWNAVDSTGRNTVTIEVPYSALHQAPHFCWKAQSRNRTTEFRPNPPLDQVPDVLDTNLTRYEVSAEAATAAPVTATGSEPEAATPGPTRGTFISRGGVWQYWPGWSEPPAAWKATGFDDSYWFSGATGMGYGQGEYATDLSRVIRPMSPDDVPLLVERTDEQSGITMAVLPSGDAGSVFLRHTFDVPDPSLVTQLLLDIDYRGGFVAYLNGVEVARRGLGAPGSPVPYDRVATITQEVGPETIDLSRYTTNLLPGANVLALQVHQLEDIHDLYVNPALSWRYLPVPPAQPEEVASGNEPAPPTSPPPPAPPAVSPIGGRLAVPLDNGRALYDVYVFFLPDGGEVTRIANARQPNFRADGQKLLINREGGGVENLYEYDLTTGTDRQVSDAPRDAYPTYDPGGNRVAYSNAELIISRDGTRQPFIFVQCGLLPPSQETEPHCRDIAGLGVLVPAGQMGEIQGTHPVWTSNDMIAYRGCNTWAGSRLCGIYIVPSASTKGLSDGFIPLQLTSETSDTPSDSKGNLIAFTRQQANDWEAYVMDLNGANVRNVSNSPTSNDGLPAISPDGNWVAFVSDRDGHWAVWAAPVAGGEVEKLFDLPVLTPWGDGDRYWLNERISWGP